jgi:hypothetical protein
MVGFDIVGKTMFSNVEPMWNPMLQKKLNEKKEKTFIGKQKVACCVMFNLCNKTPRSYCTREV